VDAPIRPIDDGVWVAERPMRPLPFLDIGTRMTVLRLPDGGLLLHSPVVADAPTRAAVEQLGPVRAIVCPNKVHHLYAGPWKAAHPDALLFGAPGLAARRRDLAFDAELGDDSHPRWRDAVDTHWVRGMPYMNEVTLLHRPSRSLLLADLAFHPTPASRPGLRFWTRLTRVPGDFGPNAVGRLCVRERAAARASIDRLLAWDFERVIVTHGEVLERGGREALRRGWAYL